MKIEPKPSELLAWLNANPGKASFGTIGAGSPTHVWGIYFQNETGTRFQFVPYRGAVPVMQDMLAGQLDLTSLQASDMLPHVRSEKIRAYAILAKDPWWAAPDIPTVDAAGVPGLHMPFWHGLWVPKATPKDVIAKLERTNQAKPSSDRSCRKTSTGSRSQRSRRRPNWPCLLESPLKRDPT